MHNEGWMWRWFLGVRSVRIAAIISVYAGWNWVYVEAVSLTGKFSI